MKAIILAGGLGSRLAEETSLRPKPMVEIGGRPILWHVMKIYSHYGVNDFIVCLGYKGYMIKEFFANYFLHSADVTIDLQKNTLQAHNADCEPWRVTLIDTGAATMTGGRLKRALPYLGDDEEFCLTYGDGVADVNIADLLAFHRSHKTLVTLTATQAVGKFGALEIDAAAQVTSFSEKPKGDGRWVSGGFFVLSTKVAPYIQGDSTIWEREPLETLSREGQVSAYRHRGFWQPMDTIHDRNSLEELWARNAAPWKLW
ncbi:MAG: glucose-1-phosphate cytidylyltransferase [Acidobacteriaceae bacterium]